jgi:hypothetical protein
MTLRDFIKHNRAELEQSIGLQLGRVPRTASCYCHKSGTDHQHASPALTQSDIREWILNDEGLYRWALSEGVRI